MLTINCAKTKENGISNNYGLKQYHFFFLATAFFQDKYKYKCAVLLQPIA